MMSEAKLAIATDEIRTTIHLSLTGDDADVDAAVESIQRRVSWMDSVRERFGAVHLERSRAAGQTIVTITAMPPVRPNVRTAGAAQLMVESALMNEMRSTSAVRIARVPGPNQESTMVTPAPNGALLAEWAMNIARQTWPECSVQVIRHHDEKATFVIVPAEVDVAEFTVDMSILVPELTTMLHDAASVGAAQHLQGAATLLRIETDNSHRSGFEKGYESGVEHGERRGRSAQNRYALSVIDEAKQRLDEAANDLASLRQIELILAGDSEDAHKVSMIRRVLDPDLAASAAEVAPDPSYSSR